MQAWGSFSFLFGPLVAFGVLGLLMLLLRWAFGRGHSLVARRPQPGAPQDYGLLVSVASPATFVEGEILRRHLESVGVRATLAPTTAGPAVLVFADDAPTARVALRQYRPPTAS